MTTETDLLPLPEPVPFDGKTLGDRMRDYARANLAELRREVEGLRAEVERLEIVGRLHSGTADLAINAARAAEARAERLAGALRWYANPEIYKPHPHGPAFDDRDLSFVARAALDQETTNG